LNEHAARKEQLSKRPTATQPNPGARNIEEREQPASAGFLTVVKTRKFLGAQHAVGAFAEAFDDVDKRAITELGHLDVVFRPAKETLNLISDPGTTASFTGRPI
jgi:hypothetical protein